MSIPAVIALCWLVLNAGVVLGMVLSAALRANEEGHRE